MLEATCPRLHLDNGCIRLGTGVPDSAGIRRLKGFSATLTLRCLILQDYLDPTKAFIVLFRTHLIDEN
jgi:hypothetical protein